MNDAVGYRDVMRALNLCRNCTLKFGKLEFEPQQKGPGDAKAHKFGQELLTRYGVKGQLLSKSLNGRLWVSEN